MDGKKKKPQHPSIGDAVKWPKHIRILLLLSSVTFLIGGLSFIVLMILNMTINPIWGGPVSYLSISIIGFSIGLLTLTFFLSAENSLKGTPLMFRAAAVIFICGLMMTPFLLSLQLRMLYWIMH